MKDFFSDALIAAVLTLGFTAAALILHHAGILYN
jgi:hypothetical protein